MCSLVLGTFTQQQQHQVSYLDHKTSLCGWSYTDLVSNCHASHAMRASSPSSCGPASLSRWCLVVNGFCPGLAGNTPLLTVCLADRVEYLPGVWRDSLLTGGDIVVLLVSRFDTSIPVAAGSSLQVGTASSIQTPVLWKQRSREWEERLTLSCGKKILALSCGRKINSVLCGKDRLTLSLCGRKINLSPCGKKIILSLCGRNLTLSLCGKKKINSVPVWEERLTLLSPVWEERLTLSLCGKKD
ncbi:hypothetical protein RRG08_050646 [Elysia crispata]|uniref:Uncharacterized protein n=1 Tax=Elysia crispata TaxID=231223 RepID=A0AAE1AE54_9GAST|nr:hypothetical protein RRG08_050646 [Elysia crispata]